MRRNRASRWAMKRSRGPLTSASYRGLFFSNQSRLLWDFRSFRNWKSPGVKYAWLPMSLLLRPPHPGFMPRCSSKAGRRKQRSDSLGQSGVMVPTVEVQQGVTGEHNLVDGAALPHIRRRPVFAVVIGLHRDGDGVGTTAVEEVLQRQGPLVADPRAGGDRPAPPARGPRGP